MAMSIATLKAKIIAEITSLYGTADDTTLLAKFAEAIATAVYNEITQTAVVSVSGVEPGGSTASGTIS